MTQAKTIVVPENIARVEARLFRLPVEPPRGDAIQRFETLELPLVQITDGVTPRVFSDSRQLMISILAEQSCLRSEAFPILRVVCG